MKPILFQYRSRKLHTDDIAFIKVLVDRHFLRGRSYSSRELCKSWNWRKPKGKLKNKHQESYLWGYLLHHYHYLGNPKLVGEHIRHIVRIGNQVVACLGWASPAWKVKDRDRFIGWDETTKRTHLHLIANNVRFLIPPWVTIKHLASKVLSLALRRLSNDWKAVYGHPVYLAETFVDTSRFQGTCYQAANWIRAGKTQGSSKRGNTYQYHGQPKELYLYPLHRNFRRFLAHDKG